MGNLTWHDRPSTAAAGGPVDVPGPVLIVAFEGWNDAGDAATGAVEHLWEHWDATTIASIDPEEFYDFTAARPQVRTGSDGRRHVEWPANEFGWAERDDSSGLVLLRGVEPQTRWRTFTDDILAVAAELRCSMLITLGALLADVPHTRPTPVFASSDDDATRGRFGVDRSDYEGPTGIIGVLGARAADAGLASLSLWAAVPSYAPSAPSPKAAGALVERAVDLLGTTVDTSVLDAATLSYERQLGQLVVEDDATQEYVRLLEQQYDSSGDGSVHEILRDSDGLVDEVERFLRDQ